MRLAGLLAAVLCHFSAVRTITDEKFLAEMQPGINVVLEVASSLNAACLRLLHPRQQTFQQQHFTFLFLRGLMQGLQSNDDLRLLTVATRSFQQFLADRERSTKQVHETCQKPVEIFVASKDNQRDFAWLCQRLYISTSIWIVFMSERFTEQDFFAPIPLPFDVRLITMSESTTNVTGERTLREVYRVHPTSPVKVVHLGYWSPAQGLQIPTGGIYSRRQGLDGIMLRTGSLDNWPTTLFKKQEKNGEVILDGFLGQVWNELEKLMNFHSLNYRSVDDGTGIREANGSWNGLLGMLLRSEIDVIVSELNINPERTQTIEFSHPLLHTRYQVYFQLPGYNLSWTAVFHPFDLNLWLALLGWITLGAVTLSVCYRGCSAFQPPSDLSIQPSRSVFFMLQSMCQQGYSQVPDSYACRLIFLLAYVLSAIIIPSYSASLISSLTAQTPNRPFDSLQEMLDYKDYKLLLTRNSAEYTHFSLSTDELYSRVFKELVVNHKSPLNSSATVKRLLCTRNTPLAVFGVESTIDLRVDPSPKEKDGCNIIKFSQPLSIVYQGLGFRKGYPFTGLMDYHIGRMIRVGVVRRWQNSVWPLPKLKAVANFKQVSSSEVVQIFLCLLIGICMAVLILLVEVLVATKNSEAKAYHDAGWWKRRL